VLISSRHVCVRRASSGESLRSSPVLSAATTMALAAIPGIFVANSGVLPEYQSELPYSGFVKWYETAHIPDWMGAKPGAITAAWRYQSLDPNRELPFLVTYKYPDVAAQSAPEFMRVTLNHPSLPEGGPINKFIKIDVLAGSHVETWRSGSTGDGRSMNSWGVSVKASG
jgi:hypothetical protein